MGSMVHVLPENWHYLSALEQQVFTHELYFELGMQPARSRQEFLAIARLEEEDIFLFQEESQFFLVRLEWQQKSPVAAYPNEWYRTLEEFCTNWEHSKFRP